MLIEADSQYLYTVNFGVLNFWSQFVDRSVFPVRECTPVSNDLLCALLFIVN